MIPTRSLPMNFGPIKGANGNARITGPCGDTMEFWVDVESGALRRGAGGGDQFLAGGKKRR